MDFNMKQWRDQQEDSQEEQPSAKIPRQMLLESPQHHQPQETVPTTTALPLFVSQPNKINTHLSDFPHLSPTPTATFSKLGGGHCFSLAQWQELELQALIYRHMVAGTAIPHELLQLVKKSLLTSSTSPYYLPHYPPHFQSSAFLQGGYWGKGAMDPEPGRCRRTDGKKWRCSRDVVAGHKYCERHMNRGRNRSRKPVEISTSTGLNNNHNGGGSAVKSAVSGGSTRSAGGRAGGEIQFSFSDAGAQLNQVASKYETHSRDANAKSNKVLMHFFDDWPTSLQESSTNINVSVGAGTSVEANSDSLSTRSLTISTNGDPTSDFLRLSTGNGDDLGHMSDRQRVESGWTAQWGANPVGSMGGPLAEALRSSTNSSSSPTSVLHQLTRRSSSDTNFVNC